MFILLFTTTIHFPNLGVSKRLIRTPVNSRNDFVESRLLETQHLLGEQRYLQEEDEYEVLTGYRARLRNGPECHMRLPSVK